MSRVMPRVCVQVVLLLCRCVFLFERGLYLSVVLRLAYLTGRGRVIVIGVPAAWTWPRPIWDASRILVLALVYCVARAGKIGSGLPASSRLIAVPWTGECHLDVPA